MRSPAALGIVNGSVVCKMGWILRSTVLSLAAIALHASAASGATGDAPGSDPAAPFFDPTSVAGIEFTLTDAARDDLAADPETYVPAELEITANAGTYSDTVGLRLKGTTSFRTLDGKAAFKVKFKEFGGEKFLGLKKLTLNNMVEDPSMIRETLAYELFRAAGVPASRTGYAYVSVNGADYGVYVNVETMDDVSLPLWFGSTEHLYEGGYDVDVRTSDLGNYEVDEGDEGDLSDLEGLVGALEGAGGSFSQRLAGRADLTEMAREWAVEKYAGAWDNYTSNSGDKRPNNYYLHSDTSGLFSIIPWGQDSSLSAGIPLDGPGGTLFEGCRSDPACYGQFRQVLATLPGAVTALGLEAQTAQLAAMLAPWQAIDPRREYSLAKIAEEVEDTREFLELRPGDLYDQAYWVAGPPLEGAPPEAPPDQTSGDTKHPETSIDRAPGDPVKTKRQHVAARFRFSSNERGSSFECRLDDGGWRACSSPKRVRVGIGNHFFRVRATDAAGNVDPWAARYRWSVRPR